MANKKKEEAEKKKKFLEEKKGSSGAVAGMGKAQAKKGDDVSDDPIAKSLKQRMAAGGLTAVVETA